jgi:hypothetical protein
MSIASQLAGLQNPALRDLPATDWMPHPDVAMRERVKAARDRATAWERQAVAEVARITQAGAARQVRGYESDAELRYLAARRADLMLSRIADAAEVITLDWLNWQAVPMGARPLPDFQCSKPYAEQLQAAIKRTTCPLWWRRQLRREAVRTRETQAMHAGEVSARTRQPYVTNDTLRRYAQADQRNRAMLEATELESAEGETINLLQAVEASTANKAIRRGELMTRIRGAEEWAEARGMVGIFTTNTCPSRFHAQQMKAGKNPKHDGSTPRDAQGWLCQTWARARAALHRKGVRFFGYRVAEPHHDGCPHWHMLLWCEPAQVDKLRETMRAYWLHDDGDEQGAQAHRFKAKALDKGGAVSYVAKYISKGIDDAGAVGAEGHTDERGGEQADMFDGTATRVQRWAAAWGIRQFQAIGQPPVTVWRELRRVSDLSVQGASPTVKAAHAAVSKTSGRRACWRTYMEAQGGAMQGREHRVRVIDDGEPREGRYGTEYRPRPVGVFDVQRPGEWVLSDRKEWKPRGSWADAERVQLRGWMWADSRVNSRVGTEVPLSSQRPVKPPTAVGGREANPAVHPWTRVINCTQRHRPQELMAAGIVGAKLQEWEPGGSTKRGNPCPPAIQSLSQPT